MLRKTTIRYRGFYYKFESWPPCGKMAGDFYESNFIFLILGKKKVKSRFSNIYWIESYQIMLARLKWSTCTSIKASGRFSVRFSRSDFTYSSPTSKPIRLTLPVGGAAAIGRRYICRMKEWSGVWRGVGGEVVCYQRAHSPLAYNTAAIQHIRQYTLHPTYCLLTWYLALTALRVHTVFPNSLLAL